MTTETLETRTDSQGLADRNTSGEFDLDMPCPREYMQGMQTGTWEHARAGIYLLERDEPYRAE